MPRLTPLRTSRLTSPLLALGMMLVSTPALAAPSVYVAYPKPEYHVSADHIILEGSVTPGASLSISGVPAAVAPDGLFMLWWPLKAGVNTLNLVASQGGQTGQLPLRVTRDVVRVLPSKPTAIVAGSVTPAQNVEFWDIASDTPTERRIQVSFRGATGGRASVRVAGSPTQPMTEGPAGTYSGDYLLSAQTSLKNAAITVQLTGKDGKTVTATAPGRLSSVSGAVRTGSQKGGTIQGLGLNDAQNYATTLDGDPTLYPREGMTFALVGKQGSDVRARLAPGQSILISASQLEMRPGAPALVSSGPVTLEGGSLEGGAAPETVPAATPTTLPNAIPSTPLADSGAASGFTAAATTTTATTAAAASAPAPTGDLRIHIPLNGSKPPFQIEQTGPGQLTVNLYGLQHLPTAPAQTDLQADPLLSHLSIAGTPQHATLTLDLATQQLWGYTANFEDRNGSTDLVISVRRPPVLDAARPLAGRVITIDPGHGGSQTGGAGSFRVPEKDIVLVVGQRVAELLRQQGATVNMTRTADTTLGLYERDLSAEATHSDLLVSIHANALPDGRDPRGIRGPEVHFSHPQAANVATSILNQIRRRLPELGAGKGLIPDANLALTRPTTQISLLVETAYLTDPGNLRALMSPAGKEQFAQAIAGGIVDFYGSQPR